MSRRGRPGAVRRRRRDAVDGSPCSWLCTHIRWGKDRESWEVTRPHDLLTVTVPMGIPGGGSWWDNMGRYTRDEHRVRDLMEAWLTDQTGTVPLPQGATLTARPK